MLITVLFRLIVSSLIKTDALCYTPTDIFLNSIINVSYLHVFIALQKIHAHLNSVPAHIVKRLCSVSENNKYLSYINTIYDVYIQKTTDSL